jgi:riboflavin kinase/FMN adenylyltransferase
MRIVRDLANTTLSEKTVLTIGTFDGVHRGHQALIQQIKEMACQRQVQSAVLAFHPRPKIVLGQRPPDNDYLTTPEERIALFEALGIDVLVLIPFTLKIAEMSAYNFTKLLVSSLNMIELWTGHDFALGRNREGDTKELAILSRKFFFAVHEFEPIHIHGHLVSSTLIRQLLRAGEVRWAAELLGRYPSLSSEITTGVQRGRSMGIPTANFLIPVGRLLPANGVYATFVRRPETTERYPSVTNIGVRPSFEGDGRTVETHIFDFHETLYGQEMTVEFVERLRPEQKFSSADELITQIQQDIAQAHALLAAEPLYEYLPR